MGDVSKLDSTLKDKKLKQWIQSKRKDFDALPENE